VFGQACFGQDKSVAADPARETHGKSPCASESAERCRAGATPPVQEGSNPNRPLAEASPPDASELLSTHKKRSNTAGAPEEVIIAVFINNRSVGELERLLRVSGRYYATADQFANWRLRVPSVQPLQVNSRNYYPLDCEGLSLNLDAKSQALYVSAPPSALAGTVLDFAVRNSGTPITPAPGLFVNHNFEMDHSRAGLKLSGLMEFGFFSNAGVLTTRFAGRDLTGSLLPYRLDTQFIRDFPDRRATLTVGDTVSAASPWARRVYYGGIRWASKFSTQPSFRPYAVPILAGVAAEPSTVDIYVNSVRTAHQAVESGPFDIRNLPVMTGQGEIQMVVTDILGRQQVIAQPYISAQQLLRKGVNEYTYEAGSLRRGFGTASAGYQSVFFAGTHRHGFSDLLTMSFHGEAEAKLQNFGVGADYGRLPLGLISGGLAVSHAGEGAGGLAYAEFQHMARSLGYSALVQTASRRFQQLGLLPDERVAKILAQVQVSHSLRNLGSVSLGYLRRQLWQGPQFRLNEPAFMSFGGMTASLSVRLMQRAYLAISANYSPGLRRGMTGNVSLVIPLGQRRTLISSTDFQEGGGNSSTIDYTQQLPVGNGYGYRVRTSVNNPQHTDAGIWLQNGLGTYGLEASEASGNLTWRLTETGSVIGMNRHVVPSRWLNDSFALVEAPGSKGVSVFANNQFITKTRRSGIAVIPNLVPYDNNIVRLDDSGVPLSIGMDLGEKTVVPMPRTGAVVRFVTAPIKGALFALVTEDGKPVPLGAAVKVNGRAQVFQVALRGEVFVPDLSFPARLQASWDSTGCEATVPSPPGNRPLPRIGPVTCRGAK
jgi:outer membrane usher protein